jgi:hypothetical protein
MGVAGLIFEPHPSNFENLYNFLRCSNDVQMIFSYLCWFQILKISVSISVAVLDLCNIHCDETKSESWPVKILVSVLPE